MRVTPSRLVAGCFAALVIIGTAILYMPVSRMGDAQADFITALFTATSAVCLTGLAVVDTATYWSHFGQVVIVALIQLGGLGIMTLATLAGWFISGKLGLRDRLNAEAEGRGAQLGDVRNLLVATVSFTALVESTTAIVLTLRFHALGSAWPAAIWEGSFHAISAFNNAGFGLRSNNLVPYVGDFGIILPISAAIIIGGLGFPLLLELYVRYRKRRAGMHVGHLSLTAIFTLIGTGLLLVLGTVGTYAIERRGVMSGFDLKTQWLASFFHSVTSRTAGFNSVDVGALHPSTLVLTDFLMFIGGGSGGTAGGIKITTAAVLLAVMVAEIRGDESVLVHCRRIPNRTVRQAMAVLMLATLFVGFAIMLMLFIAPEFATMQLSFEVISAFATVGLSTGITAALPALGKLLLVVLMFAGRVGPVALVAALAARKTTRMYSYAVERPIIG